MIDLKHMQVSEYDHEIQDYEQVCEVTGYVYHIGLSKSPHIDENGELTW